MVRIGIIGCGRILAAHLQGYRVLREAGINDFQITALCARKEDDARSYVKRGEGPPQRPAVSKIPGDPLAIGDEYLSDFQPDVEVAVYTDYEQMIAEGPVDAINDFTIHSLHHQIAEIAFRHGKHVMSQKPLAVSMEAARRMCARAREAGVSFGVFENARFRPHTRQLQWAFREGGPLGRLQMALLGNVGTWWAPDLIVAETPWRHMLDEAGGMALDMGPHMFDLMRCIGGEIRVISGQTEVVEPVRYLLRDGQRVEPFHCDADDTFYATFQTESGASGIVFGSWGGHGKNTVVGEGPVFYGSHGRVTGDTVHLDGEAEPKSLAALYDTQCPAEQKEKDCPLGLTNDFALNQYDWLRAVQEGRQPETSGEEGLRDLACSYAIVESAHAGRRIEVADVLSGKVRDYQIPIDKKFSLL